LRIKSLDSSCYKAQAFIVVLESKRERFLRRS
jgi:hypothetical protein